LVEAATASAGSGHSSSRQPRDRTPDRRSGKIDGEGDDEEVMSPLKTGGQTVGKEKEQMPSQANRQLF
jgi:hypothetical protein